MRLVPTSNLQDGTELARDVLIGRADGVPLLRAGVVINARFREGLIRAGVNAVYIEDEMSRGITPEPLISDQTRAQATRVVARACADAQQALSMKRQLPSATIDALAKVVSQLLDEIADSPAASMVLSDLHAVDAYTFQHSIDVTALGLLLGFHIFRERGWVDYQGNRQFTRLDERLLTLGLGLILHDIGKLAIRPEIVHKQGKLTEAEWTIMKTHPRLGVELLPQDWSPLVKAVVLRHHERWDGTGYPDGKQGTEIHEMARIAAIADTFDAVTSERVFAAARPPCDGVKIVREGAGTAFDADFVTVFSRLVPPFPPGVAIELADGRQGIVVAVPDGNFDRPLVRVISGPDAPYEIALAEDPSVRIAGWDTTSEPIAA
jgi:HD-GYP domain-containing protein (c-di-GMP phosphodiesterase class II)